MNKQKDVFIGSTNTFRHQHKFLDSSCKHTKPPIIKHAKLIGIKTHKFNRGGFKYSNYTVAQYKCNDNTLNHIFCSRGKWIQKKPICSHRQFDTLKNDAPNFPVYLGICSESQMKACKHFCILLNGEPMCSCPPGYKKSNNNQCLDINECEDPQINITCKYGCVNTNGSYACLHSEDVLLSDDPKDKDDYESDEDYDDEEYDEDEYADKKANTEEHRIKATNLFSEDYKLKKSSNSENHFNNKPKSEDVAQNNNDVSDDEFDDNENYDDIKEATGEINYIDKIGSEINKVITNITEGNQVNNRTIIEDEMETTTSFSDDDYDDEEDDYDDEEDEKLLVKETLDKKYNKFENNYYVHKIGTEVDKNIDHDENHFGNKVTTKTTKDTKNEISDSEYDDEDEYDNKYETTEKENNIHEIINKNDNIDSNPIDNTPKINQIYTNKTNIDIKNYTSTEKRDNNEKMEKEIYNINVNGDINNASTKYHTEEYEDKNDKDIETSTFINLHNEDFGTNEYKITNSTNIIKPTQKPLEKTKDPNKNEIKNRIEIVYDDEYDYDYEETEKPILNSFTDSTFKKIDIDSTTATIKKLSEKDNDVNEVYDKYTQIYNTISTNYDDGDEYSDNYDDDYNITTTENTLITEANDLSNNNSLQFETTTFLSDFNTGTKDVSETDISHKENDNLESNTVRTSLIIATTNKILSSLNEVTKNSNTNDTGASRKSINISSNQDDIEDSYDENDEKYEKERIIPGNDLDKNKTIEEITTTTKIPYTTEQTVRNYSDFKNNGTGKSNTTDNILTTTYKTDTAVNIVSITTEKLDKWDKIDTTTPNLQISTIDSIDRINTKVPNLNTEIYDDEYDYESSDYEDSKKEESTVDEKEISKCEEGYKFNDKGQCIDIDECTPETNPCSDICENTAGSYMCICPAGFKLNSADPHTCQDIDECEQSPCSHVCKNMPGSFRCECPDNLTLQETTCVNLTCSQGQTRINGVLQCTCAPGFVLEADNRTCKDMDECLLLQDCAHNCKNVIGSYECSCREGYRLEREKYCVDIDECAGLSHACDQLCENTLGSFKCACEEGYEFKNGSQVCIDIDECNEEKDLDECNHICINYQGGYECSCHSGFKLGSDDATCEDIDECLIDNGNCTHICENLQGSYQCKCEENYLLENDNHTCIILDPCLEDNGGCSHECTNNHGTAVCRCPKGYTLEDKDCYLYDPCVSNNGGCSHICVNVNNAVRCECPPNYELVNSTTCSQINMCTINNGNCSHFCEFVEGKVNCMCPELYRLQNSTYCVEINPCLENNGGCSHICTFKNHVQSCSCPETHRLHNTTHCFERNPCLEDNGGCSDICNYKNSVVTCSCPKNYYLEGKTCYRMDLCLEQNGGCSHICSTDQEGEIKCLCPENFFLKDSKNCAPQDPCLVNNGNCSHICNSTNTATNICSCTEGYQLINNTHCERVNPCTINNGGCSDICENIFGNIKCSCPVNYELDESQKNCVILDPCHENNGGCSHICEYLDKEVICSCPDHYNLINNTNCVKVNACLINNGGCSHECNTDDKNNAICSCPKGYELLEKTCVLINPCNHKNGGCSHVCTSIEGIVVCKCPPGFELIQKTCFKINPCKINNGGCSHGCIDNKGEAKCTCPPGYKLFGRTCMDEDPCTKNNGGCSHFCHNKEGKRHCSCPAGYLLRPNKRICKEINECRVNRGGCSHGCKNLPGSYQCTCPQGLHLDNLKNKTCMDVDECLINNGGCDMICRNFKGGFKCDCPDGYTLQRDKRSCRMAKVAQCRVPPPPKNGVLRCWDEKSDLGSFVAAGTKCNTWCNEGYKLVGNSQRICSDSGHWGDNEPYCIVATCPKLPSIQNGWYLPGVCNSGRTYIGESCSIYCRKGFTLLEDVGKFMCDENMNWTPLVRPEILYNACVRVPENVYINCSQRSSIDFILPPGERHMHVKIPRPTTNVDWSYVTSQPSWGTRLETTLPAGRTEVRFIASSQTDFNTTSSCRMVINILDKEAPYMRGCPENIERRLANGESTQIIYWKEPMFYDNVGVATVYKTREPGSEFGSGLHHITYVASDEAGNRAFCHFSIDVRDDLDNNIVSNSIEKFTSATYTSHRTAGKYRAVLICPSGVQYMTNNPDQYNNAITSEAGCYWKHVKITNPLQPQSYSIPKIHTQSRLPPNARNNRRVFFKWSR